MLTFLLIIAALIILTIIIGVPFIVTEAIIKEQMKTINKSKEEIEREILEAQNDEYNFGHNVRHDFF